MGESLEWEEDEGPEDSKRPAYFAQDGAGLEAWLTPVNDGFGDWGDAYKVLVQSGSAEIECDACGLDEAKDVAEAWRESIDDFNRHFHSRREARMKQKAATHG